MGDKVGRRLGRAVGLIALVGANDGELRETVGMIVGLLSCISGFDVGKPIGVEVGFRIGEEVGFRMGEAIETITFVNLFASGSALNNVFPFAKY